jgi:hypothetical protein
MKLWKKLEPDGRVNPSSAPLEEVCAEWASGSRCPGCTGCPRGEEY